MSAALGNTRHERFAQAIAAGETNQAAYLLAFPDSKGARQSSTRLRANADIALRIAALQGEIAANLLQGTLREKNSRLQLLQNRCDLLREVIAARAAEYRGIEALASLVDPSTREVDPDGFAAWAREHPRLAAAIGERDDVYSLIERGTPAGMTGLILRDFRGKSAEQVVFKVDTGLLAELRKHERQAAEELGEIGIPTPSGGAGGVAVQVNVAFVQPAASA